MSQECLIIVQEVSSAHGFELTPEQMHDLLFEHTAFPFASDMEFIRGQVEKFFQPLGDQPELDFDGLCAISAEAYERYLDAVFKRIRENPKADLSDLPF